MISLMKTATIFTLIVACLLMPTQADAQSYIAPSPIMSKKLLKDFIHAHIVYPEVAKRAHTEGDVVIKFNIAKDGQVTKRWISKHVSDAIDSSALKLFDLIIWNPATSYGIPIESTGEFEIPYNLKKYAKYVKSRGYDQLIYKDFGIDSSDKIHNLKQLTIPPEPIISDKYDGLEDFIYKEMKYPEEAQKLGIKGSVTLSFIIEVNGLPSNIYIEENLGGGCCEESIRILQLLKWTPGMKENLYVRTKYEMTFYFNPADNRSKHIPNQSNSGL
jgi:TonB family protein